MLGVNPWVRPLRAWLTTPTGRKAIRYLCVSAMNFVISESVLGVSYLVLHLPDTAAAALAVTVSTIPAYFLNRMWVWGRTGRSHLVKEVIPFWALACAYLVLSVGAADAGGALARSLTGSRSAQTLILMASIVVAAAVLWAVRYLVLDAYIFPRSDYRVLESADVRG